MSGDGGAARTPFVLAALAAVAALTALACGTERPAAAPVTAPVEAAAPAPTAVPAQPAVPAENAAPAATASPDVAHRDTARNRAFGYLLDSPRPFAVIDQGLAIAERLRQRYGIDTGNPEADRRAAALKFQAEVLDRLRFDPHEIDSTAQGLGYSLDPAQCLTTCENVRRLAVIELQKRALEAFADGREMPGRMP